MVRANRGRFVEAAVGCQLTERPRTSEAEEFDRRVPEYPIASPCAAHRSLETSGSEAQAESPWEGLKTLRVEMGGGRNAA